ncbi:MAG: ParB/Srx family N-terminal domain-containing protein [Oligoflexia bacterium]|nr:ParB/Srx family N-terminal domain-containing protein [Oligoflexia bacterium]
MDFCSREIPLLALALALTWGFPEASAGKELEKVEVLELHPTQFNVGLREVDIRSEAIRAVKDEPKKLKKLLKDQPAMVVKGPGGKLYLVDGHHFTRALAEEGIEKTYVEVVKDWSELPVDEFWAKMEKKAWVYWRDQGGPPRGFDELPATVRGLTDDPYRSLAWLVREAGGYRNEDAPFQEFAWADYFREHQVPPDSVPEAIELIRRQQPSHLPGYRSKCVASFAAVGQD